ncbi:hypothetical protein KIS1582_0463 [Cytobacillus firmus]|uniref:Uncharacterized protein n=1 Tax=Cytobacillus firmus TaxID=1399 RepID=A0A800NFT5_CYTFI|nr:hypothetical protein KIS1582_0463 [Cytobacillus firmus]
MFVNPSVPILFFWYNTTLKTITFQFYANNAPYKKPSFVMS